MPLFFLPARDVAAACVTQLSYSRYTLSPALQMSQVSLCHD